MKCWKHTKKIGLIWIKVSKLFAKGNEKKNYLNWDGLKNVKNNHEIYLSTLEIYLEIIIVLKKLN